MVTSTPIQEGQRCWHKTTWTTYLRFSDSSIKLVIHPTKWGVWATAGRGRIVQQCALTPPAVRVALVVCGVEVGGLEVGLV